LFCYGIQLGLLPLAKAGLAGRYSYNRGGDHRFYSAGPGIKLPLLILAGELIIYRLINSYPSAFGEK
jgi:hypothetical protein